jgi:hypothetical protein
MKDVCLSLPAWAHPLVFIALFAWEAWLGYRKFFGASSTIQMLAMFAGLVIKTVIRKDEK